MNSPIRLGVLGAAKIARRSVLPAIQRLRSQFELVAVASRDPGKAAEWAQAFDCEAVTGYERLLERTDLDAVYVPLPTGLHRQWIGAAIERGLHVYAEKSFALHAVDAVHLVEQAERKGLALMEGFMFLHHPQIALIRRLLDDGAIGELRHFSGAFGFPPLPAGDFRYDEAVGGGVLMDAAGYPVRAASHFLGDDLEVVGSSVHRDGAGTSLWGSGFLRSHARPDRAASVAFGFDNFYQCRLEIWGSRGKLSAERVYTANATFSPVIRVVNDQGTQDHVVPPHDHFGSAFEHFHALITRNSALRATEHAAIVRQARLLKSLRDLA